MPVTTPERPRRSSASETTQVSRRARRSRKDSLEGVVGIEVCSRNDRRVAGSEGVNLAGRAQSCQEISAHSIQDHGPSACVEKLNKTLKLAGCQTVFLDELWQFPHNQTIGGAREQIARSSRLKGRAALTHM